MITLDDPGLIDLIAEASRINRFEEPLPKHLIIIPVKYNEMNPVHFDTVEEFKRNAVEGGYRFIFLEGDIREIFPIQFGDLSGLGEGLSYITHTLIFDYSMGDLGLIGRDPEVNFSA